MNSLVRALIAGVLLASAAGCSGNGGFLGTGYNPKGDLTLTDPQTNAVITTTASNPLVTNATGFSLGIQETNFNGPYTVTITSWTNGFNVPCFGTKQVDTTDHVNIVNFYAENANGSTTANPCTYNGTDTETALITDGKGHTIYFYFILG